MSLDAGHNLTRIEVTFQCEPAQSELLFAAGLALREGAQTAAGKDEPWISLWGPVEPKDNGDLGTGVVMDRARFRQTAEQDGHHLIIASAKPGEPAVYYAGAGWTRSGDFAAAADWSAYLAAWARRMAAPLQVRIQP